MDINVKILIMTVLFSLCSVCSCQMPSGYVSAFINQNIEIVCDVGDSFYGNIIWKFVDNDVWLAQGGFVYENIGSMYNRVSVVADSSQSRLRISGVRSSDAGMYQCGYEASPRVFAKISETSVAVVNPASTPTCNIRMLPNLNTVVGNEVDVKCAWPSALPMGHAIIHKNGVEIDPDVIMDDHVVLRTLLNDGDTFTCQLVSPLETERKACVVIPLSASGLKVRSDPLVATVMLGGDVEFNCTAEANEPIESYLWSLKADAVIRFLSKPGRFRTEDNSRRLTLFNLELVDDKLWVKCSAETQDGTSVLAMSAVKIIAVPPTHPPPTTLRSQDPTLSLSNPTRRTPLKLPKASTTTETYDTLEPTTNVTSNDVGTPVPEVPIPLPISVIALISVGGLIVFLIMIALVVLFVKIFMRRSASKDVDRHNVNTTWVMSTPEITMSEDVAERPRRFGRKSRSSSRKFLYSRRSSKKKNRSNGSSAQKPTGVVKHLPPQPITPDPRAIYQNIPRSGSSNSLHSIYSVKQKLRGEMSLGYEEVKLEPPDVIGYKKPKKQLVYPNTIGDDGGYASVEDPEEVPHVIYAELDITAIQQPISPRDKDFDPSILYAKVKK